MSTYVDFLGNSAKSQTIKLEKALGAKDTTAIGSNPDPHIGNRTQAIRG